MATTNVELIAIYRVINNVPDHVILHTFARWNEMGFSVKHGEHSRHRITIWKSVSCKSKNDPGKIEKRMILKESAFFDQTQVEPLKRR